MSISLRPSDATEGGRIVNDMDVEIKDIRFEMFDYNGKSPNASPGIVCNLVDLNSDEEYADNFWSVGSPSDWAPSDDGKSLVPLGTRNAPSASCNAMQFLASLVNNGLDEDLLADGDISVLNGLGFHAIRAEVDVSRMRNREPGSRVPTYIIAKEILFLPGEKNKWMKSKGKSSSSVKSPDKGSKKAKKVEEEDEITQEEIEAAEVLASIIEDQGGKVSRKSLPGLVFKYAPKGADKNKLVKLITSEEFLGKFDNFEADSTTVSIKD